MKGYLLGFISVLMWSVVFVMGRYLIVNYDMAPIHFAWVRYAVTAPILLGIILAQGRGKSIIDELKRPWGIPTYAVLGLLGCFGMSFFQVLSLPHTQATTISMLMALAPFFTLVAAVPLGERITIAKTVALVLGFSGAALITLSGTHAIAHITPGPFPYYGEIMALLSGASWGIYTALGKGPAARVGGLTSTFLSVLFACFFFIFAIPVIIDGGWPGWPAVIGLSFVGIGGTAIGFAAWYAALNYVEAGKLSMLQFLTPMLAYIQAALLLGERVTIRAVVGFILVIAGLIFVTRGKKSELLKPEQVEASSVPAVSPEQKT